MKRFTIFLIALTLLLAGCAQKTVHVTPKVVQKTKVVQKVNVTNVTIPSTVVQTNVSIKEINKTLQNINELLKELNEMENISFNI